MKIQPLKIGTKTAKVPVIQGGMGVGISLGNLAGAVAKEGGIGIISAAQPGFREEDFIKDPLKANLIICCSASCPRRSQRPQRTI